MNLTYFRYQVIVALRCFNSHKTFVIKNLTKQKMQENAEKINKKVKKSDFL